MDLDTFTYDGYLERWDEDFGDDDTGEREYYVRGRLHKMTLHKMTSEQHAHAVTEYERLAKEIDEALQDDNRDVGKLFDESFPHEMALFL